MKLICSIFSNLRWQSNYHQIFTNKSKEWFWIIKYFANTWNSPPSKLYTSLFIPYPFRYKKILIKMFYIHTCTGLLIPLLADVTVGTVAYNSRVKVLHNSLKQHQGVQYILLFTLWICWGFSYKLCKANSSSVHMMKLHIYHRKLVMCWMSHSYSI